MSRRTTQIGVALLLCLLTWLPTRHAGAKSVLLDAPSDDLRRADLRLGAQLRLAGILTVSLAGTAGLALGAIALTDLGSRVCIKGPCPSESFGPALGITSIVLLSVALVAGAPLWATGQQRINRAKKAQQDEAARQHPPPGVDLVARLPSVALTRTDGGAQLRLRWSF